MSLNVEGHMGLKSSPLATTSCKLTKQFLVLQHLNAHHKKLSNVKSSIDTTCPKSWYKHVNVRDQVKREKLARERTIKRPLSAKSQNQLNSVESYISGEQVLGVYQPPYSERDVKEKPIDLTLDLEKDDIIDKNCNKFTDQKSFTPRILKNDKTSKLSQLKCYNAPKRKMKEIVTESDSGVQHDSIVFSEKTFSQLQSSQEKELSSEEIRLKELDFLKELTDDILLKHNFTDVEVEQTCEYHIKRNKYGLSIGQMRKLCSYIMENSKGISNYSSSSGDIGTIKHTNNEEYYGFPNEWNITTQDIVLESSTPPARLQLSNDDLESNQMSYVEDDMLMLSKSNSLDLHAEFQIDKLRETMDNIKVEEDKNNEDVNDSKYFNATFPQDETTRNVRFASQNETYSAHEADRSLTDVSPIQVESSEDSTSASLSLEMNKTSKNPLEDAYFKTMHEYIDDFEN